MLVLAKQISFVSTESPYNLLKLWIKLFKFLFITITPLGFPVVPEV